MSDDISLDLDEIYEFAVRTGKEAGALLLQAAEARFGGAQESKKIEKENAVDLVTQTDIGELKHGSAYTRFAFETNVVLALPLFLKEI